ncbi:DUF3100 domain-containing protein [Microbacterium capsulatum]|uniref:DUF3100 domain-containing protein n=1 Tax=Microbacterium capsulatum TaxID=3041921 RepID=A0ABU0XDY6_9MICO|nr:DUF3100 domain-containing protein [Microbacterium sp. ASV81]MDQ4213331.1 DUF3100 domain-containing protein [Microbacterium sp. ASV81]
MTAPSPGVATQLRLTLRSPQLWILIAFAVLLASGAQLIGPLVIPIGIASVTLLPMIWGLVAGAVVSGQRVKAFPVDLQHAATTLMGIGVLVLAVRLSFEIGPQLPLVVKAGPALLLQELGHMLGTIALALPLAVLLKMGPATIGATFSIDRETSFAMVSERYGADSPQYRGVLSMYVFGTVFGALLVSLIASVTSSLGIFDPRALAMGAGVGSGSMMAAAAAAVVANHPELSQQVLALAATSNLITSVLGLYVGVWVALPLAERFYRVLTRGRDDALARRIPAAALAGAEFGGSDIGPADVPAATPPAPSTTQIKVQKLIGKSPVSLPLWTSLTVVLGVGVVLSIVATKAFSWTILVGYGVIAVIVLAALGLSRLTRGRVPAIVTVMTVGILSTSPFSPVGRWVLEMAHAVDFLSITTFVLTFAGLSLGKDLPMLRSIGWKILPVGFVAITASFVLSVLVAELVLRTTG